MPSTLVHLGIAALLAAALLGRAFGPRALAVVLAAVALVDLDVFVGYVVLGAHRAAFHNLLLPGVAAVLLAYDTFLRSPSSLVARFGRTAPRVAWATIAAVVFAAIGPDLVTNGANLFYPVHDQFYAFDGKIRLSDQRGIVQTFVQENEGVARGSSTDVQYRTGADPNPTQSGADADQERIFLVVNSGFELLVVVTGIVTAGARLVEDRMAGRAGTGDGRTAGGIETADRRTAGGAEVGEGRIDRDAGAPDGEEATATGIDTGSDGTGSDGTGPNGDGSDPPRDGAGTGGDGSDHDGDPWVEVPGEETDSE